MRKNTKQHSKQKVIYKASRWKRSKRYPRMVARMVYEFQYSSSQRKYVYDGRSWPQYKAKK